MDKDGRRVREEGCLIVERRLVKLRRGVVSAAMEDVLFRVSEM